jgi:hypothetical protein
MSGSMDTTFGNTLRMVMYNRFVWECLLEVEKENYDLDGQGDDFDVYHDGSIENERIYKAYYTVWGKNKTGCHGLGQILKYLKFGTIADTTFCSTECFYCDKCQSYRIVRQLERFITLNQWSKTLLSLSNHDQAFFLTSLCKANELWIGQLDIFKQANQWLDYNVHLPSKTIAGKPKKMLPVDPVFDFMKEDLPAIHMKLLDIDPSYRYSMLDRISPKGDCCNKAFREQVLTMRYGLEPSEIDGICQKISNTPKGMSVVLIPELIDGFATRKLYDASSGLYHADC